jgi:hypothetical protein
MGLAEGWAWHVSGGSVLVQQLRSLVSSSHLSGKDIAGLPLSLFMFTTVVAFSELERLFNLQ